MRPFSKTTTVDYRKVKAGAAEDVKRCPLCRKMGKWFPRPGGAFTVGHVVIEYEGGASSVDIGCDVKGGG